MKNLIKNKAFDIGFIIGMFLFILINLWVEKIRRGTGICFDCVEEYGFPFFYLETGGNPSFMKILWIGLIGDIFIAIFFSFIIGLIFKFLWSKPSSKQLK